MIFSHYLEMSIKYNSHNPELPGGFGGVSGDGVWQGYLSKDSKTNIEADD